LLAPTYDPVVISPAVEAFTTDASAEVAALLRTHGWTDRQIMGQLEALEGLAASEDGLALIAPMGGVVAGFMSVQVHAWNRLAQMHGLAVRHDQLRRGCATRLIEAAEAFAREQACRGIYVDTPVDNEAARAFYLARGYSEDYRMTRYYADDLDGITYVKFFGGGDPL
jgi:ribosomal protein S18 acetylase RimI-like enzyme